ncbi:MAG TPA: hypothetical protein VFK54_13385 [Candidatus Limnocylindrales bacterium]|nr:hypothetical protein [Candidatus Limnocylindrales bacterium]
MSAAQTTSTRPILVRYTVIALVTAAISILAVAAPSALLGLGVLVAPFVFVGLATDVDPLDLARDDRDPFGPELRALPTV